MAFKMRTVYIMIRKSTVRNRVEKIALKLEDICFELFSHVPEKIFLLQNYLLGTI